ncbi:uncharacterized protein [Gossypium hirsutum]|uniref:DNA/RNA polymerases superfamily protein n=1 Tax=Gossypium hirsutum TaxID=3635 RepID=A0ABM2ZXK7_GOSHI|nr:uncharacterized protein LOC121216118 [Gossypium hirsutum]
MNDIDCTLEHKLKDVVSLLRDEVYQWWLSVEEGIQPDRLNWDYFNTAFQGKYVGSSYVDACSDKYLAEYGAKFLRLSHYAQGMVASEYEKCVHFEDDLRDSLRRPKKWARLDGPVRVGVLVAPVGIQPCGDCGRRHQYIGSTHSYVASTVSENLGIFVECTSGEITVLSLLGQSVRLVEHRVSLNYATKRVVMRIEDDKRVVVICEHRDYLSNVISTLVAKKLVRKGCEAYLAYVNVLVFEESSVRDIKIVREFSDVFPEELLGLPLNRKVEFCIELLSGTAPVSIALYRITPKELIAIMFVVVFVDDILVYSKTEDEYDEHPRSRKVSDIHSFLGLVGYYRCFVEGFSLIGTPLTKLLRKGVPFV